MSREYVLYFTLTHEQAKHKPLLLCTEIIDKKGFVTLTFGAKKA
jgi:hypothetical protein